MKKKNAVNDLYESYFFGCVVGGFKTSTVDAPPIGMQKNFVPHITETFSADIVVIC
jgi:hypothetical protein